MEIISSENVKPSSPTPHHLKTYKLSMLDQIMLPTLIPLVLYFPPNNNNINSNIQVETTTVELLKRSLSLILTRFYPLAGRLKEDVASIDCNDQGIPFVVAKIKGPHKLSDVLMSNNDHNHELASTRLMFPCDVTIDGEMGANDSVAMIQLNYFDCGGVAIASVFCHAVADANTIAYFLNSWAAATRSSTDAIVSPNYIPQSLFPHKHEIKNESHPSRDGFKSGKTVMKRYVFDSLAISKLKAAISSGVLDVERPSRVEAVSALIWKCFMIASLANNSSGSMLVHAVNLRRRAQPRFSSDCFGNFVGFAPATSTNHNEMDLGELVRKMRDSISTIDGDFVNRMHGDQGFSGFGENLGLTWGQVSSDHVADTLYISSWCGIGLYDIDFGWGKPIWISRCYSAYVNDDSESAFMNLVGLMDTRLGDGIEAWVVLDEKYMPIFDNVEELRTLASTDPPLHNLHI